MSECKTCQVYEELKDLWRNRALAAERARDRAEARVDDLTSHANERNAEKRTERLDLEMLESFVRRFVRIEEHGEDSVYWCVVAQDDHMPPVPVSGPEDDPILAMILAEQALACRKERQ